MWRGLEALLGRKGPAQEPSGEEEPLALQRRVRDLQMELAERERRVATLKSDLERQRSGERARVDEAVQARTESLLAGLAGPLVQLLTQRHLAEVEGRPVQTRDVLALVNRLVRVLEDEGVTLVGGVGHVAPFDPNRHEPLSSAAVPAVGQPVVVRFVGAAFKGKLLRKAGVEVTAR